MYSLYLDAKFICLGLNLSLQQSISLYRVFRRFRSDGLFHRPSDIKSYKPIGLILSSIAMQLTPLPSIWYQIYDASTIRALATPVDIVVVRYAQFFPIYYYYCHLLSFYSLQKFDNKVHNIEQLVTKQKYGSLQKTLFHKIWLIRRETAFNLKLPFSALMILFFLIFSLYLALVLYCDFYYSIKGMNNLTMPVMQRVISATICFLFQVDTYIFKHMALKIVEHSIRVPRPSMSVCKGNGMQFSVQFLTV